MAFRRSWPKCSFGMSPLRTAPPPTESGPASPSLLTCGIGMRLAVASVACGLLWLAVLWALA
jgi:hypothetical protein